jgi:protein arginine N-methyltransferase 3
MEVDGADGDKHVLDDEGESSSIITTTDSDSCSSDSSSHYDDDDDEDDREQFLLQLEVQCPFCSERQSNSQVIITQHVKSVHGLDIVKEFSERGLDCIDFIKLINFLRSRNLEQLEARNPIPPDEVFVNLDVWKNNDSFMRPVLSEDPLLTFDIESLFETTSTSSPIVPQVTVEGPALVDKADYATRIQHLQSTIDSMKACMKNVMEGQRSSVLKHSHLKPVSDTSGKDTAMSAVANADCKSKKHKKRRVKKRPSSSDTNSVYFSSYSHFGIHHEMLSDRVRTNSYKMSIVENQQLFKGAKVLDVGCGTGILSLFSASAGATRVTAVDDSDIAFYAMMIVAENKFKQTIDVVKTRLEQLPDCKSEDDKYDVIISEWMGYFLVYEGMLDTVITARDRFLKKGGVMLPSRSVIKLAGLSDQILYDKHVSFWNDVYGYSMSSLRSECITEPLITVVKADNLCSNDAIAVEIDSMTCTLESTRLLECDVVLKISKTAIMNAIVGWFDCFFEHDRLKEGNNSVILSTSPHTPDTHWKQTVFLLKTPVQVNEGTDFCFRVSISRPKHEDRALKVDFVFSDKSKQEYVLI